ncbi:MAG TPA: hypothetical protein VF487_03945 [Chitinophagaceae bacterium]
MMNYLLYIDPGSGSYLIQVIVAAAMGIVFFFRNIRHFFANAWLYIKSLFTRSPKQ